MFSHLAKILLIFFCPFLESSHTNLNNSHFSATNITKEKLGYAGW